MRVRWTVEARSDLVRLHHSLAPVNRGAAARIVQSLRAAPGPLREHPRLGGRLNRYSPREVRRIIVGDYELRYEIAGDSVIVLNIWHTREDR